MSAPPVPPAPPAPPAPPTLTLATSCTVHGALRNNHNAFNIDKSAAEGGPDALQTFCSAQGPNCIFDWSPFLGTYECNVKESDWKCSDVEDNSFWSKKMPHFSELQKHEQLMNMCEGASKNYCETVSRDGDAWVSPLGDITQDVDYFCRERLPFLASSCDPPKGETHHLQQESCSSQGPNCIFVPHLLPWTDNECDHVDSFDFDCSRIEDNGLWSSASVDTRELLCKTRTHGYCNLERQADMSVNCRRARDWVVAAAEWPRPLLKLKQRPGPGPSLRGSGWPRP